MNSDFSQLPPEERALRLTALLLGELSPAEAEAVRLALAADQELTREHDRLQQTIALVRETAAMDRKTSTEGTPLRLDDQRREKLLAAFKTPSAALPAVVSVVAPHRPRNLRFLPLALAAALVGLLIAAVLLPMRVKQHPRAERFTALPGYGATEKSATEGFGFLFNGAASDRRSGRGEAEKMVERKSELALTENFSTSLFDTEATKVAPAPKLPSIALALPVLADMDGDARELKQLAEEFDVAGLPIKPMAESLARGDVSRELARGNEVAFGNSREFFNDSAFNAPAPSVPMPGAAPASQLAADNRWDVKKFSGGSTLTVALPANAMNPGALWSENGVDQRASLVTGGGAVNGSSATPSWGSSVYSVNAAGYANTALDKNYALIPSTPAVPPPVAVTPLQTRFYQVDAGALEPALRNVTAHSFGESQNGGGGGGGRGGGGRNSGRNPAQPQAGGGLQFVTESTPAPAIVPTVQNFIATAGVDLTAPGKAVFYNDRTGTLTVQGTAADLDMVDKTMEVLNLPSNQSFLRTEFLNPEQNTPRALAGSQSAKLDGLADSTKRDAKALGVEFESKTKAVEDRFGRADDFSVTPEVLDAVKLQIQNAPSYAGAAGVAMAKDNLSASRPSLATTPDSSGRLSVGRRSGVAAPAPTPAPPVSGPAANGVAVNDFIAEDAAGSFAFAGAITNSVVNYFSDLPATDGDNTLALKVDDSSAAANNAWFGGLGAGNKGLSLGRTGTGIGRRMESRVEKIAALKSDANGRVEVQLPAVADGGLQFRGALSPDQSTTDKAEVRAKLRQSLESELTKETAAGGTPAGTVRFQLQSTNSSALPTPNSYARTNVLPAKAEPSATSEPVLAKKVSAPAPTPQPEMLTRDNAFSTFSLNVADVSFKLAAASLEKGAMPDVATIRSEEFINAFDYRDPVPMAGVPLAFVSERARYPFAHNRDALRFSVKTAAQGRDGGRPLNIVLLLDNSGSMERADRVRIIQEALRALAAQLQPQDKLSVVTFSRTARLWADGVSGAQAAEVAKKIATLTPEGGTNLEEALDLAYRTALRHYAPTAMNRVVLLTDGAANLGNVEPATLKAKVESFRKQGVALDCFGIGWDGFNDDLLEQLSRNGDGRYGFVNTPEEASTEFAAQLAGALQVAASDVKVQVEFNPKRVTAYRQIGYAKHQLTKQQFRDNTVDAAEISASEAGNALYVIETNPRGEGPVATVRARFRVPQTSDYREHEWVVPFGSAVELEQSSSALRLATSASAFSEWLAGSPFAGEVTTDRLLGLLTGVPEVYGADPRPKKLEWMIRQAKSISGK